jgi:hypothetical protein
VEQSSTTHHNNIIAEKFLQQDKNFAQLINTGQKFMDNNFFSPMVSSWQIWQNLSLGKIFEKKIVYTVVTNLPV